MEISRISSKGQVTIPKSIRQLLNLAEGDRVAFIKENGKVVISKAGVVAFRQFAEELSKAADEKGITEEELLNDLERVREKLWNERNK